ISILVVWKVRRGIVDGPTPPDPEGSVMMVSFVSEEYVRHRKTTSTWFSLYLRRYALLSVSLHDGEISPVTSRIPVSLPRVVPPMEIPPMVGAISDMSFTVWV